MDARARILNGERLCVRLPNGTAGLVYLHDHAIVYDVREGWAAGVVEPICSSDSDYLERRFLVGAIVR